MGKIAKQATKATEDKHLSPVKTLLEKCTACAAGSDFSM